MLFVYRKRAKKILKAIRINHILFNLSFQFFEFLHFLYSNFHDINLKFHKDRQFAYHFQRQ